MKRVIIFVGLLLAEFAGAQGQSPPREMEMCKGQIELYCQEEKTKKDFREVLKCLAKNDDKLSTECKQEVQRLAQASRQTTPPGGGPLATLGGLAGIGAQLPSLSYEGRFIPGNDGSPKTPSLTENNLNLSVPIYKKDVDTVALTLGGGNVHLSDPITLNSGVKVPTDLNRAETGIQYSRRLEGRKTLGVRGSVGYAGDKMNSDTQSFSVSANYSFPGENENRWVLLLMMSNNSPLGAYIPVPGFFYIYTTPTFTGIFGFPILSLQWTPVNPWAFSFSFFGPTVRTEASYGAVDQIQFFTGLGMKQQRFLLSERTNENDRLTFEEKYAEIGLRRPLFKGVSLEAQAGYSFDRSVYLGEGLFNKDRGDATLDSDWYAKWSLKVAF